MEALGSECVKATFFIVAWFALTKAREASKLEENPPAGTPTIFSSCYSSDER
jgi:hypothetical protein